MAIRVGIFGATGYTGVALAQILHHHPGVIISFATSEADAGKTLDQIDPQAPPLPLIHASEARLAETDHVFLCLPHTASAPIAARALSAGCKVVDLSADLRLDTPAEFSRWYHADHPAPGLLPAPYGLTELNHDGVASSACVANPGCYATSILLPLLPLARCGLISREIPLIIDAKSGVSGAGRSLKSTTQYGAVQGNFSAYGIGREHRHIGEIEQELAKVGYPAGNIIFSPHLLPVHRGILSTIYVPTTDPVAVRECLTAQYALEPLVSVLPEGQLATLHHVVMTPLAAISVTPVQDRMAIILCTIDNLLKGASSQAIQNFNLMWGLYETMGLIGGGHHA